jgi:Glycosyl hydrolases family 2, TIM barrel domain/Glycosyl hydrolases family 2, sugar binding domain/Glycosyl hydrolases family 2
MAATFRRDPLASERAPPVMPFPRATILVGAAALAAVASAVALGGCGSSGGSKAAAEQADPAASPLRATASISLDNGWRFYADPRNLGIGEGWSAGPRKGSGGTPVTIPDDFNPTVVRSADAGGVGWYALRFTGPPAVAGRSWNVHFDEVRRTADVWLNGRKLGANSNPYAPFSLRATSLRPDGSNLLVVRVDSVAGPGSFPQDWWNWGGIVRNVSLQPVGRIALSDLGVMPQLGCRYRCGQMLVQGMLRNVSGVELRAGVEVQVTSPAGSNWSARGSVHSLRPGASTAVSFRVPVQGRPRLWSPSSPALYRVQVATTAGRRVEQVNSMRVGMRTVGVRHGILYLNGRRLWLHGAAIHEDAYGRGAALDEGDVNTIVSQLLSVGANITRSHYLLSDSLLDALDTAGILVWSQPPVDHADAQLAHAAGRNQALSMLRATILGERSHPSVIVDSIANELTPAPDSTPGTLSYLRQAIPLARGLDPAAAVALDVYCYPGFPAQRIYSKLDVLGIDSYFGWYTGPPGHSIANFSGLAPFLRQSHARYPTQALVVSEFGVEALFDGPATTKGSYDFQTGYLRRTYAVLDGLPFMNGSVYWALRDFAVAPGWTGGTQLPAGYSTDGLTHKGLLTYDGTPKPAFAVAAQLFGQTPAFAR